MKPPNSSLPGDLSLRLRKLTQSETQQIISVNVFYEIQRDVTMTLLTEGIELEANS
jgi:hypothetical protein